MAVSDEQQYASKRERQKARRAARLEEEAQAAAAAGRKRTLTYGIFALLIVGLIGGLIFSRINASNAEVELAEDVAARLDALGCTEDARMPDLGGGHISGDSASLAAEPPDVIYPDQPPSSGRHIGQVVPSGVFDVMVDPRFTTHNLEHGYVVVHYDADSPEAEVAALKESAQGLIDGDFPKLVVAEYPGELPEGANVTFSAWFFRQACEQFDEDVLRVFLNNHYDTRGEGPEKGIPGHTIGSQGVVDPAGEDLLLPPLDVVLGEDATDVSDEDTVSPETDPDLQNSES